MKKANKLFKVSYFLPFYWKIQKLYFTLRNFSTGAESTALPMLLKVPKVLSAVVGADTTATTTTLWKHTHLQSSSLRVLVLKKAYSWGSYLLGLRRTPRMMLYAKTDMSGHTHQSGHFAPFSLTLRNIKSAPQWRASSLRN